MRLRFSIRVKHTPAPAGAPNAEEPPFRAVEVTAADTVLVGRRSGAALQLPLAAVSAEHARFLRGRGGWCVEDLGSTNGTLLGERRLVARVPEPVSAGDAIVVGGVEVRFDGEVESFDTLAAAGTATLARRLVHDVFLALPPAECCRLRVLAGPAAGRELLLSSSDRGMKLGRGDGCDWVIPDEEMSREHASFERACDGIVVRDLGSKNGLVVNGRPIGAGGTCPLHDGQTIALGHTRLQVVDPEERYLRQMEELDAGADGGRGPSVGGGGRAGRLTVLASTIAATTLLLCLGLVLALVFLAKV